VWAADNTRGDYSVWSANNYQDYAEVTPSTFGVLAEPKRLFAISSASASPRAIPHFVVPAKWCDFEGTDCDFATEPPGFVSNRLGSCADGSCDEDTRRRYSEYVASALVAPTEYAHTPVDQATYFRVEDTSCSLVRDLHVKLEPLEVIDVTSDSECEAACESHAECRLAQVRKPPSWPGSWANISLFYLYPHRNAWANLCLLGQP
jgi:hypothetical protein